MPIQTPDRQPPHPGHQRTACITHRSRLVMSDWRVAEAHNQAVFRQRNEQIRATQADGEPVWFVCECGDRTCVEAIQLSPEEYEAVRSDPLTFALAVNHENPEAEAVITENDRYAVVAVISQTARDLAQRTDPRRR